MNKLAIGGIIGVLVMGVIAVYFLNQEPERQVGLQNNDPGTTISRPAVKPVPNTFSIMTPEERAAAEEAKRLQAEQDALASSTASTSASSTAADAQVDAEIELVEDSI